MKKSMLVYQTDMHDRSDLITWPDIGNKNFCVVCIDHSQLSFYERNRERDRKRERERNRELERESERERDRERQRESERESEREGKR